MRKPFTAVHIHLVWATWDRQPLLRGEAEAAAYACVRSVCAELGAEVIALNGAEDHVHLLVRLPMTVPISTLAQRVKGASSHLLTHELGCECFKWQGACGAFSVERKHLPLVQRYVERQKQRHAAGDLWPTLEKIHEDG
ncbi:MAG TPA: IS200/IS605 family transposase [Armatimonadota bacterium]|jgi:REP element-mobilizing transposase RayT